MHQRMSSSTRWNPMNLNHFLPHWNSLFNFRFITLSEVRRQWGKNELSQATMLMLTASLLGIFVAQAIIFDDEKKGKVCYYHAVSKKNTSTSHAKTCKLVFWKATLHTMISFSIMQHRDSEKWLSLKIDRKFSRLSFSTHSILVCKLLY